MNAPEIAFWVATIAVGVLSLAWYVHLRRQALRSQRVLGGGR